MAARKSKKEGSGKSVEENWEELLLDEDKNYHIMILDRFHNLSSSENSKLLDHLKSHFFHPEHKDLFLSENEADLLDRMRLDWEDLNRFGTSPQEVGERLYQVIFPDLDINARCRRRLRTENHVPDHITITTKNNESEWVRCPFLQYKLCDESEFASRDQRVSINPPFNELLGSHLFRIVNKKAKLEIEVPGILCHLAADHSFFPGDIEDRVEPIKIAKVLELV